MAIMIVAGIVVRSAHPSCSDIGFDMYFAMFIAGVKVIKNFYKHQFQSVF